MAKAGTPVYAICDGRVVKNTTGDRGVWDSFLVIEHKECLGYSVLFSYNGHIRSQLKPTHEVRKGEIIGNVKEWTGDFSNSHLHFGLSTKLFSGIKGRNESWGYQAGDLEGKGWLNPESLLRGLAGAQQGDKSSRTLSAEPQPTQGNSIRTPNPRRISNPGKYRMQQGNTSRHFLNLNELCRTEFKEKPYYQGRVLSVRHSFKPNPNNRYGDHYCIVQYQRPEIKNTLISPWQRHDLLRVRTAVEWIENLMAQTCYKRFKGSRFVRGAQNTALMDKAWCELTQPTTKIYFD